MEPHLPEREQSLPAFLKQGCVTKPVTTVLNTILTFMVQAVNSILAAAIGAAGGHQLREQSPAPPGWEGGGLEEGRQDAQQAVNCEWAASPGTR